MPKVSLREALAEITQTTKEALSGDPNVFTPPGRDEIIPAEAPSIDTDELNDYYLEAGYTEPSEDVPDAPWATPE